VQKITLLLGKSTKTAATRAALFDSNMHQIVCRLGLRPRPHWRSLQRSLRPYSCILGAYFQREGRVREEERRKRRGGTREEREGVRPLP